MKIEIPEDLYGKILKVDNNPIRFILSSIKEKLERLETKTLILCGGEGTRMRPITFSIPKPMLPLGYKPVLHHIVDFFKDQGFKKFIFSVGYLSEIIVKYFGDGRKYDVFIDYVFEREALGTGGAIKNAEEKIHNTFFVGNGDVIFKTLDLNDLLKFHREKKGIGTIVIKKVENAKRFGLIEFDKNYKILEFREKPEKEVPGFINAGLYVFEPEIFDYIEVGKNVSIEREVFPKLAEEGKLYAYIYNGYWIDIGIPQDYEKALKDILTTQ